MQGKRPKLSHESPASSRWRQYQRHFRLRAVMIHMASEGRNEHHVPVIFWVLYPLCGAIWMDLLDLGRAMLGELS